MRKWILVVICLFVTTALPSLAQGTGSKSSSTRVRTYTKRSSGTVVYSHRRSTPDRSFTNNWSTRGNRNPYTGSAGTKTYRSRRSR